MAEESAKGRGLLDGISVAQLIAGALAAVTSMLLASYIGIAGSVIGVAVGSIVSTVSSQLYRRFLATSAEKLREIPAAVPSVAVPPRSKGHGDAAPTVTTPTPHLDDASNASLSTVRARVDARRHDARMRKGVAVVSIASALVAVAVSAAVIEIVTQGEGLGAKPQLAVVFRATQAEKEGAASDGGDAASEEAPAAGEAGAADGSGQMREPESEVGGDSAAEGGDGAATGDGGTSGSGDAAAEGSESEPGGSGGEAGSDATGGAGQAGESDSGEAK